MKNRNLTPIQADGFTLLEMLLVVVIIGILTVAGVNLLNSQSIERQLQTTGQNLIARLNQICERAILENRAHGLEWGADGIQVVRYGASQWQPQGQPWRHDVSEQLRSDGVMMALETAWQQQPHIICQSDGSLSAFDWRAVAQTAAYQVKTINPWQLNGQWYESP